MLKKRKKKNCFSLEEEIWRVQVIEQEKNKLKKLKKRDLYQQFHWWIYRKRMKENIQTKANDTMHIVHKLWEASKSEKIKWK